MAMAMATLHLSRRPLMLRPPISSTTSQLPALFFRLPPSCRTFHACPRPQYLDTAITTTHTLLTTLHSVSHTPWCLTLPLAAFSLRAAIILPLSIYSRRTQLKQAELTPLLSAWTHHYRRQALTTVGHLGPAITTRTVSKDLRQKTKEIYGRMGIKRWVSYLPLAQLPVWLLAIETIRKMCGLQEGLLGIVSRGIFPNEIDASSLTTVGLESAFATEGALWFPNLLLEDPEMYLPFMLSASILLNLSNATGPNAKPWQRRLTNSMRIVALAMGPLMLHVPSAMLVYWISSSLLAYIQARLLDWAMPVKSPVVPCRPRTRKTVGATTG